MLLIGYIIGTACGIIQLLLLRLLVASVSTGLVKIWIVPVKMGVLALSFLLCFFVAPDQIVNAGVAAAATLSIGAVFMSVVSMKKKNNTGSNTFQTEGDAT